MDDSEKRCGSSLNVPEPIASCLPTNWRSEAAASRVLIAPTDISNDCSLKFTQP